MLQVAVEGFFSEANAAGHKVSTPVESYPKEDPQE